MLYRGLRDGFLATTRGKHIGEFSYFHRSLIIDWSPITSQVSIISKFNFNVVKLSRVRPKFSLLTYSKFEVDPFPALAQSVAVSETGSLRVIDYTKRPNPPILHRKELLLPADDPLSVSAAALTNSLDAAGLLQDAKSIGTVTGWQRRLSEAGYELRGETLVKI